MPTLIKNKEITENPWQCLFNEELPEQLGEHLIVSTAVWNEQASQLSSMLQSGKLGLFIDSDQTIADLPDNFEQAALIAVHFPSFVDGRCYSVARELRQKKDYKGELRAVGEVLHDQLQAMARCGIDAYELSDGKDAEKALAAFNDFSAPYQADVIEAKPVYRR